MCLFFRGGGTWKTQPCYFSDISMHVLYMCYITCHYLLFSLLKMKLIMQREIPPPTQLLRAESGVQHIRPCLVESCSSNLLTSSSAPQG